MVSFKAQLQKFGSKGEKTGWTYIEIPAVATAQLNPGCKKSFRVKGKIDEHSISAVALTPMGKGAYILAVNATMRKAIRKIEGASVNVRLTIDEDKIAHDADLLTCLLDEQLAHKYFKSLPPSHQNWFSNWVKQAKTENTKTKRLATVVTTCINKLSFSEMMRSYRAQQKLTQ